MLNKIRLAGIALGAGMLLFGAGAASAADCNSRIRNAERDLARAENRYGAWSRQANDRRNDLRRAQESCGYNQGAFGQYGRDRDYDRDRDYGRDQGYGRDRGYGGGVYDRGGNGSWFERGLRDGQHDRMYGGNRGDHPQPRDPGQLSAYYDGYRHGFRNY